MKPTRLCPFCFNPLADNQTLLEEENAKLRELVSDLWSDLENQLMPPWSGEYERRIRGLGIEVTP